MSVNTLEVIDSQFNAENVQFDDDFSSVSIAEKSISTVREYLTKECKDKQQKKKVKPSFSLSINTTLDSFNSTIISQSVCISSGNRNLRNWGLPDEISKKYEQIGIKEMFDWQVECLNNKVLSENNNLVYSAPTSAGKTLVAEILTIKTILERRKKVIIILPFVSIVREKTFYLQEILSSSGIRVEGFMGSQSPSGRLEAVHVAVCTIEKANSLINKLLDEGNISILGALIVDELHLLGDPSRGYILELLLTKIRYVSSKFDHVNIQIIGMSATLPNLHSLASWLDAELYITDFRPIPLDEFCIVEDTLYDSKCKPIAKLSGPEILSDQSDIILKMCLDTIREGCSVLIFCMTKNRCESLAQTLASTFFKLGSSQDNEIRDMLRTQLNSEQISEVLQQLKNSPVGLDPYMTQIISFGVAYHHAGLSYEERDIIEGAFKSGAIRVLVATSTLSSGVNLPARKVIIRSPVFQKQPISNLTYKQMVGRAGRMGKDSKGEAVLVCSNNEKIIGFHLMLASLDPVKSCLNNGDKYMRAILEIIASETACTMEELTLYTKCTLISHQNECISSEEIPSEEIDLTATLSKLVSYELVRIQTNENKHVYVATSLGKACLSSSMGPVDALTLFSELEKARKSLVLDTDLHLVYLVTPFSVSNQWGENIDWLHFWKCWESLSISNKMVGSLVGVNERFVNSALRGKRFPREINIHKRFYTALALQDLINEVPLSEVANNFQCSRGFLQSLQQAAATFAGMVTAFCRQLRWKNMELLISQFQDRLNFGIHSELIELMKLSSLNGARARSLFDEGFQTVADVASADVNALENVIYRSIPFQSEKDGEDETKRKQTKHFWITGSRGVTVIEFAENLVLEARKYLEQELGIVGAKWVKSNSYNCNESMEVSFCNVTNIKRESNVNESLPENTVDQGGRLNPLENDVESQSADIDDMSLFVHSNCDSGIEELENTKNQCIQSGDNLISQIDLAKKNVGSENKKLKDGCHAKLTIDSIADENNLTVDRDEMVWDTIEFTESAIQNITKTSLPNELFCASISFEETEEKTTLPENIVQSTNKSSNTFPAKDVSLFSSDGDNSSLFNDSLPVDLIPSKLLDFKYESRQKNLSEPSQLAKDGVSINSNTLLREFNHTGVESISHSSDEDITLFYEDDIQRCEDVEVNVKESQENITKGTTLQNDIDIQQQTSATTVELPNENAVEKPLETEEMPKVRVQRDDFEINIFDEVAVNIKCTKNKSITEDSLKTNRLKSYEGPLSKKARIMNSLVSNQVLSTLSPLRLNYLKNSVFHIRKDNMKVIELRGSDIKDNINEIKKFTGYSDVAVYLHTQPTQMLQSEIDIMFELLKGISLYFGKDLCLYLNLESIKKNYESVKKTISTWLTSPNIKFRMLSLKTDYLCLKRCFEVDISVSCEDVLFNAWLLSNFNVFPSVNVLIKEYCENLCPDLVSKDVIENNWFRVDSVKSAAFMALCVWEIVEQQRRTRKYNILKDVLELEQKVAIVLANCEYYGVAVDKDLASQLLCDVKKTMTSLELKAGKLLGRSLNFNSTQDVAKALRLTKTSSKPVSTKKAVLTAHKSELASVVIYWRKLKAILTHTLYPITEKAHQNCDKNKVKRITPTYTMYTSTGRISMESPNLQIVPRPFSIPLSLLDGGPGELTFNCRCVFRAEPGYILVSADYCQLEMRILTHFCEDELLTRIMSSGADVFKSIAAEWSNKSEDEVDDDDRQKAKQLCYGIIYGMGSTALAQQLDITECDAFELMASFYATYRSIKPFTEEVLEKCKQTLQVETLMKRPRFLPDINSPLLVLRRAAERKAINTTIQGSAADIVKAAMVKIDAETKTAGLNARLVLQLHDELIYEVPKKSKMSFARILKEAMENTVTLRVPLPVKLRVGDTWGALEDFVIVLDNLEFMKDEKRKRKRRAKSKS